MYQGMCTCVCVCVCKCVCVRVCLNVYVCARAAFQIEVGWDVDKGLNGKVLVDPFEIAGLSYPLSFNQEMRGLIIL